MFRRLIFLTHAKYEKTKKKTKSSHTFARYYFIKKTKCIITFLSSVRLHTELTLLEILYFNRMRKKNIHKNIKKHKKNFTL